MKTQLFTVLLISWDITNQQMFHSKIVENHVCNPNMFFGVSSDREYKKNTENGVQRGTQNVLKIIENPSWDLPESICVHP